MSINYTTLANEINGDPLSLGYVTPKVNGNDQAVANLLNALTGPGAASIFRNDIQAKEIINAIVAADFAALTALQLQKLQVMTAQGVLDATVANIRTIFLAIFSGMTNTVNALTTLASRTGSRAEVLFGTGTVITPTDVSFALRGTK